MKRRVAVLVVGLVGLAFAGGSGACRIDTNIERATETDAIVKSDDASSSGSSDGGSTSEGTGTTGAPDRATSPAIRRAP